MSVRIEISENAKEVARGFKEWPRAMAEAVAAAMNDQNALTIGHITQTKLSQRGPTTLGVGQYPGGGRLRASIRSTRANVSSSGVDSSIGTNVKYAGAHEYGTKPFTIRPRKASVLRFVGRNGPVFARFVNHPGLPARRPIGSGIEERSANYSEAISKAIEEAWGK